MNCSHQPPCVRKCGSLQCLGPSSCGFSHQRAMTLIRFSWEILGKDVDVTYRDILGKSPKDTERMLANKTNGG